MATARPFAYNIGAPITGTDQVGALAVGTPTVGFTATGLEWWNGPDEDLGYVIAQSVPGDTQPTPVSGVLASVGFFRSAALTDPSFISIANAVAGPSGGGPFASGSAAKTWLNDNGYWTSYVGATGATGAAWYFYGGGRPPSNNGETLFINQSTIPPTITLDPNNYGGENLQLFFNSNQADGTSYLTQFNTLDASGGTIAISQGGNTVIYQGNASVYTVNSGSGFSTLEIRTSLANLIQPASALFTVGTPITIAIS
jgi:hypothetical protein